MSEALRLSIFHEVNDRIAEITGTWQWEDKQGFLCECAAGWCTHAIWLTRAQYEAIRADPARFFTLAGHERPAEERVVERNHGYVVVERPADAQGSRATGVNRFVEQPDGYVVVDEISG